VPTEVAGRVRYHAEEPRHEGVRELGGALLAAFEKVRDLRHVR
jgi:hypothetical protein